MKNNQTKAVKKERRLQVSRRIFYVVAGRGAFILLVTIALTISFFLIWNRVAVSLLQEAGLPVGISSQLPEINARYVQDINEQHNSRVNHQVRSYTRFETIFVR
jgi:hypothetical protein